MGPYIHFVWPQAWLLGFSMPVHLHQSLPKRRADAGYPWAPDHGKAVYLCLSVNNAIDGTSHGTAHASWSHASWPFLRLRHPSFMHHGSPHEMSMDSTRSSDIASPNSPRNCGPCTPGGISATWNSTKRLQNWCTCINAIARLCMSAIATVMGPCMCQKRKYPRTSSNTYTRSPAVGSQVHPC